MCNLRKTDRNLTCYCEAYHNLLILVCMTEFSLSCQVIIRLSVPRDLALSLGVTLNSNVSITSQLLV